MDFDYIISGAGAAGLSLLLHMVECGRFSDKKILLVDKAPKELNDRTWCFWEQSAGLFEPVVHHSWKHLDFFSSSFSASLDIQPYTYKMIRGIDFYNYVLTAVSALPNVTIRYGNIQALANDVDAGSIIMDGKRISAEYVFNSILLSEPLVPANKYWLKQHFKGWMIETPEPRFDSEKATFMDFRVSQQMGTTFVYVLPVSPTKALVEYTLFSKELLQQNQYEEALKAYILNTLGIENYTVVDTEFGVIPMTNIAFKKSNGRIINIGTAGGQTKASSGFTFRFIQKQAARIVKSILSTGSPLVTEKLTAKRFGLYDSTLLNILSNNKLGGDQIFADLFRKNDPARVLRFLDNESSFEDELNIMNSVPASIFMKAAFEEMFR